MLLNVLLAIEPVAERRRFDRLLRLGGIDPVPLPSRRQLWEHLTHEDHDLVVLGGRLLTEPPEGLIESIRRLPEHPDIIIVREREDPAERARLLAAGCLAVLWQGLPDAMLTETLRTLVNRRREDALSRLRADRPDERYTLVDFVYASPAMQRFLLLARRMVATNSTLLILGETGVGKERLARAIHAEGPRAAGPFMAVNCGALPESLLESELFGHEEGAFTGATRSRKGYFEMAHRGTIFLDEIGEMPHHLQVKLLRVLESHTLHRVGGERPIKVDVRVMAATNRDPEAEIQAKRFRLDLYYRLAVVTLTIPPLRERREDIPLLVQHYVERFRVLLRRQVTGVTSRALDALTAYEWPGNVRELINVIERAVLLCSGSDIDLDDLPPVIMQRHTAEAGPARHAQSVVPPAWFALPLQDARQELLASFERAYLTRLLEDTGGRISDSARRAGINERSLYDLMRRYGLRKEAFRKIV
jgi:two-component system, NtrC family, response regulator AtoC